MVGQKNVEVRAKNADYVLIVIVFVLVFFGLIVMYSISPIQSQKLVGNTRQNVYFVSHLMNVLLGLVAFTVASKIRYWHWRDWSKYLMAIAIFGLVVLLIPGLSFTKYGATRWLRFGSLSFQPAELMKLALVVYLAAWFEGRKEHLRQWWDGVVPFAIMLGLITVVVVFYQRDLGTMLVLAGLAIGMYYIAGIKLSHLAGLVSGSVLLGGLAIVSFPHRVARVLTFLSAESGNSDATYHIRQALIAVGSGGIFGLGLGRSIQVYGYLPEAPNDSIFAIIAEEFGLIGAAALIILFGLLIWRALRIARLAPDNFSRLLAIGMAMWIFFQAMVNIGAMLAIIPLTGIPLPFISYGGSSLIVSLFAMGILVNISKYRLSRGRA